MTVPGNQPMNVSRRFPFERMIRKAKQLIDTNGVVVRVTKTSDVARDPGKSWRGVPQRSAGECVVQREVRGKAVLYNADESTADEVNILKGELVAIVCARDFANRNDWDCLYVGNDEYMIAGVRTTIGANTSGSAPVPITFEFVLRN